MKNKFKIGDIICIKDKNDPAYNQKGFYKILDENYSLYSLNVKRKYDYKVLRLFYEINYKEQIESYFRLATKEEIILYVESP
jgi:hypothetical protein